jgi:STE24 endopeptidase
MERFCLYPILWHWELLLTRTAALHFVSLLSAAPLPAVLFFVAVVATTASGRSASAEFAKQRDLEIAQAASTSAPANSTRASPPAEPQLRITAYTLSPALYQKAHRLGRFRFAYHLLSVVWTFVILFLILQLGWSAKLRDWADARSRRRSLQAIIYVPLLILIVALLELPLEAVGEWNLKSYGISVQSWASWIGDWDKLQLLSIVLGTSFAGILYAVIRRYPRRWWLAFWVVSLPILLFIFFLEPVVIDPLFNKYEPLSVKAPQLIPALQRVTRRAGIEVPQERMFWMQASNKTIVPNAYVTGFGASKRIVIWDTALAQETTDGILTVFGHELGHYALNHIWKGMVFFSFLGFVLLYLGYRSIGWLLAGKGRAWGIRSLEDYASLPALLLLACVFGFVADIAGNAFSRYQENQADVYGLEVTRGIVADPGQAAALSFQKFGESVFVDPDPNPIYVLLFFDHPTVSDRIHLFATYETESKGKSPQFVK